MSDVRLFVALPMPAAIKSALSEKCSLLRERLPFQKWVHPEDFHITLKFLGDTSQEQAAKLSEPLRDAARTVGRFPLAVESLGIFGPNAAPRILWGGVRGDLAALHRLQQAVESAMAKAGYAAEEQPYRPHISLARRYKGTEPLAREALASHAEAAGLPLPAAQSDERPSTETTKSPLSWQAEACVLYVSHLGQSPMYEIVERYPLKGT
ncbi:RNA 2',3'-cyclic phosphodiesterase [Paenibacillus contaminans]|uniref:RNA 2',3'-cyclic phosphodiesterase n=1 Tax=Paenibacillus contaminans TaxID=450362 RepID=A0A329MRE9_9BACL|nr:RNA 2',3'-cyclic phosphodiesterase [Paenibacillus contaminans]RAV22549.1 RNA 2',3'-cyclic phosphodiesterase [Paenibacillus contaminans]